MFRPFNLTVVSLYFIVDYERFTPKFTVLIEKMNEMIYTCSNIGLDACIRSSTVATQKNEKFDLCLPAALF